MALKNRILPKTTKATFSVTKDMLYAYGEIDKSTSEKRKKSTDPQAILRTLESVLGSSPEILKNIEEKLALPYVSEKGEDGNLCMANSPEVRYEYKDSFTAKDLLDYMYAVLHSPRYLEKFKHLSKIDVVEVSYPNDQNRFWKWANLGAQLQQLHLSESSSVEKHSDATTANRYCPLFRC